jgi:hypothetical protein
LNGAIAATALHGEWVVFLIYRLLLYFTLDAAAAANYRDALLRNSSGTYNIKGTESYHCAVPPTVFQVGTVLLLTMSLFGTTVTDILLKTN